MAVAVAAAAAVVVGFNFSDALEALRAFYSNDHIHDSILPRFVSSIHQVDHKRCVWKRTITKNFVLLHKQAKKQTKTCQYAAHFCFVWVVFLLWLVLILDNVACAPLMFDLAALLQEK